MNIVDNLHAFVWREMMVNNCNSYFINGTKKILIDPGHERHVDHVRKGLKKLDVSLENIDVVIATHGHPDHVEAVRIFEKPTLITMSEIEYHFNEERYGNYLQIPNVDFFLQEGDLKIGDYQFQILLTPGHSPGSISIYWPEKKVLFAGDVVFKNGIGRTDLPGGKGGILRDSIERLAKLDVEYLLTGHGEIVTGKEAVMANFDAVEKTWFSYLR
ncbi:MAG: MBL fold metallo-hydrolase [Deltaproteobacteria bacterium]|nr:MBL fold metallo-hydrolase [Deltaproteobacteria bacterium]